MKSKKIHALCLFILMFCCGCQNTADNRKMDINASEEVVLFNNENIDSINYDFPTVYKDEIENVQFDTDIIVSEAINKNGLHNTEIQLKERDYEKPCDIVFKDVAIETKNDEEAEYGEKYGRSVYCIGTDERSLYMNCRALSMSTKNSGYIMRIINLEEGEEYNADRYLTGEEFDFMSIKDAYQCVLQYISDIGINMEDTDTYRYTCYSLNYKTMEETERIMKENTPADDRYSIEYKEQWTEEDNAYLFVIHQYCQDCIVQYPAGGVFPKISDINAPITVLITKNGIERVDSSELFEFEQGKECLELLKFEDIASCIAAKYNMILTDSKYIVKKAELYWRPVENEDYTFDLVPTWEVSIEETSSGKSKCIYMNALNGEEIV